MMAGLCHTKDPPQSVSEGGVGDFLARICCASPFKQSSPNQVETYLLSVNPSSIANPNIVREGCIECRRSCRFSCSIRVCNSILVVSLPLSFIDARATTSCLPRITSHQPIPRALLKMNDQVGGGQRLTTPMKNQELQRLKSIKSQGLFQQILIPGQRRTVILLTSNPPNEWISRKNLLRVPT